MAETISCACGCGTPVVSPDDHGRLVYYAKGHNVRRRGGRPKAVCTYCAEVGHSRRFCNKIVRRATREEMEAAGLRRCLACGGLPFANQAHVCAMPLSIRDWAALRPGGGV